MKFLQAILFSILLFSFNTFSQNDIESISKAAHALERKRKFAEAAAEIGKAIELKPSDAQLYLRRAQYHWLAKNNDELVADVIRAISIDPLDKRILVMGGELLKKSGNLDEAARISDALFALGEPDFFAWQLRIGIKIHRENFIDAYEDTSKAIELFPTNPYLKQGQANLLRLMGDSGKALEMYASLISALEGKLQKADADKAGIHRELSRLLFSRANLYFEKADKESAAADLRKSAEYSPDKNHFFFTAKTYARNQMYPEALADINKAMANDQKDRNLALHLFTRGDILFRMKQYKEALKDFEEAIKLDESFKEGSEAWIVIIKKELGKIPANSAKP